MRIYVEKKKQFRNEANILRQDIENSLGITMADLRIVEIYDSAADILAEDIYTIFSNRVTDEVSDVLADFSEYAYFRVESLPTQFDQRKYWANRLLGAKGRDYTVNYSRLYAVKGVAESALLAIKQFVINPLESYQRDLHDRAKINLTRTADPSFASISLHQDLKAVIARYALSMSEFDLALIRDYFASEGRDPNYTELKMLDTYWSDHCRHTTFSKIYQAVDFSAYNISKAKEMYDYIQHKLAGDITLMNLALFSVREQRAKGGLADLDISDEINACTIMRHLEGEDFLIMFKNETHNHPTEIEPFGGAATCIGGAIRDPLAGRAFVYQAMRISGAAKPDGKVLKGKLPQRQICQKAAHGFSSYGNQIGLNTGYVNEYYHPDFVAKRLELGFVIGSVKKENVIRQKPQKGDLLVLLGGKTGIDGVGGAAGSSKVHQKDTQTIAACEVQKGNAPEERKLQRLFRIPEIAKIIKRCNDLGAGGISVAFGEICDGLELQLENVHLKYSDIFANEIFLSESQERMAIVIAPEDLKLLQTRAKQENVTLCLLGKVTDNNRFVVKYHDQTLIDIARAFLNTAGAKYYVDAKPKPVDLEQPCKLHPMYSDDSHLMQMFDSSIGGKNVLNPYGGRYQKTRVDGMVSIIPGTRHSVSVVSVAYDPYLASWSPFHGAYYAVLNSALKNIALGSDLAAIRFTFQEYFESLSDVESHAKPLLALLGANVVLKEFELAAIGGKDSMSGTYYDGAVKLTVPPTLVSFAVNTMPLADTITPELKAAGHRLVIYAVKKDDERLVDLKLLKRRLADFAKDRKNGFILSAGQFDSNLQAALDNMARGNKVGYQLSFDCSDYVGIVAEVQSKHHGQAIGETVDNYQSKALLSLSNQLYRPVTQSTSSHYDHYKTKFRALAKRQAVRVFIPIFEGTNCEDDMKAAFRAAGAHVQECVFTDDSASSLAALVAGIEQADILALAGGFSAADEPDGSAKFIANIFRTPIVERAFNDLIARDGLVIGICNGFQALVNLGVFNDNKIEPYHQVTMALSYNENMSHIATYVDTKIVSNASPFLRYAAFDKIYKVPISHGEGRLIIDEQTFERYCKNGQIFSIYLDAPNGSYYNIEGLLSPNGQILGKMAHNERVTEHSAINIYDKNDLGLFKAAVDSLKAEEK